MLGEEDSLIKLEVPNRFFLEWIKEHYQPLIEDVLRRVTKKNYTLEWNVSSAENKEGAGKNSAINSSAEKARQLLEAPEHKAPQVKPKRRASLAHNLSKRYTFERYIVGKANEFAHAACFAVTKHLGSKYNPLFIYGGVGLGKTHLLQAIGNHVIENNESANVCYYTSERFMNEFINFVSRHKMSDFRKKFRNVDLLLIDDIQFWGGKERTQEEFFHTFNALYESHKQIVVTSDKFPKEIDGIEERLRSRFEWGLVADIQPPDMETKVAIIRKKATEEAITLPDEVAMWLASISGSNVRELEGYLNRILAVSSLTSQEITLDMSKEALKNIVKERGTEKLTMNDIQKTVSEFFNIKQAEIKSKRRHRSIAGPRQVAMYIAREHGDFSYPEIGFAFGGKDHSTAIHAVKKITKEIKEDIGSTKKEVKEILLKLGVI